MFQSSPLMFSLLVLSFFLLFLFLLGLLFDFFCSQLLLFLWPCLFFFSLFFLPSPLFGSFPSLYCSTFCVLPEAFLPGHFWVYNLEVF